MMNFAGTAAAINATQSLSGGGGDAVAWWIVLIALVVIISLALIVANILFNKYF